ncbi:MAG: hypothetical protein ACOX04_06280 [Candidatus Scatomorpha sp.]|jgi:hypothetical protein
MKRITSLFLAVLLLFSLMAGLLPVLALEEEKEETEELPGLLSEEVIYALMGTSGNVDGMYRVKSTKWCKFSWYKLIPRRLPQSLSNTQQTAPPPPGSGLLE